LWALALIVTVPGLMGYTVPNVSTTATDSSDELHANFSLSRTPPPLLRPIATNVKMSDGRIVSGTKIVALGGKTRTDDIE
jgi:hypothetical protein